ncbi:MAG TPA: hypothetical protein PK129_04590 [Cellvibrionaceae bacterium]|nr:hypothetical protein [Cellvibrionaceae bacterium]
MNVGKRLLSGVAETRLQGLAGNFLAEVLTAVQAEQSQIAPNHLPQGTGFKNGNRIQYIQGETDVALTNITLAGALAAKATQLLSDGEKVHVYFKDN